jgi:hypothetical protein
MAPEEKTKQEQSNSTSSASASGGSGNASSAARRKSSSKKSSGSSGSSSSVTKSESPVAARAALDEGASSDRREQQAKEQERQQAQALKDGVVSGEAKKLHDKQQNQDRATLRHVPGQKVEGPIGGFVDQLTARPGDALEGHFVKIDLNADNLPDGLKESGRDFGVYVEPATIGEDGYPLTAQVRLRDETNQLVTVPYAALRNTEQRGR